MESLPIDQYYLGNPDELFDGTTEDLIIDLDSKVILGAHLQCAGQEMPISPQDECYFGPLMRELCDAQLMKDKDGWWESALCLGLPSSFMSFAYRYHTHPKFLPYPSMHISIRGSNDDEKYTAIDVTRRGNDGNRVKVLEEIDLSRALFEIYEGAVVNHAIILCNAPFVLTIVS